MAKERVSKGRIERVNEKYVEAIRHSSSERVGICETCGQPFEQVWRPNHGEYTSFKTCGICRALNARGEMRTVLTYTPHPKQQIMHDSPARFKVLSCGIRFGKDRFSITESIRQYGAMLNEERGDDMVPGVLWWIIAPTMRIARQNWRELRAFLPREWVINVSFSNLTVETINGGIIEVHSADDPESLVAVPLDIVTITEAARIKDLETVWDNIEGRLNSPGRGPGGNGGIGIINSSPKGRNYFYKMYCWGQKNHSDYDPLWESWIFETWDNPYMAVRGNQVQKNGKTYRENLQRRMSKRKYEQDYLGRFLAEANSMFPDFEKNCVVKPPDEIEGSLLSEFIKEWEAVDPYETYTIGYDPAKMVDRSPILVRNSRGKVVKVVIMQGKGWDAQWDEVAFYSKLYNHAVVNFGKTGLGETIESQLQNRGVPTNPINEQGRNKEKLVENYTRLVEQSIPKYIYDDEVIFEHNDYEYKTVKTRTGTNIVYGNASNDGHDDIISAAYFAFADFDLAEQILPFFGRIEGIKQNNKRY